MPTVQVIKQEKPNVCPSLHCAREQWLSQREASSLPLCNRTLVYREHFSLMCTKYGWQGAVLSHMHKIWLTGGSSLPLCTEHWFTGGSSLQLCTEHWFTRGGKSSATVCRTPTYSEKFSPIVKTFPQITVSAPSSFWFLFPICLHPVPFSPSVCTQFPFPRLSAPSSLFPVCLHPVPFSLSVCTQFPVCLHLVPFSPSVCTQFPFPCLSAPSSLSVCT